MRLFLSVSRLLGLTALSLLMTACASYKNMSQLERGSGADFVPREIEAHRVAQDKVLVELAAMAGTPLPIPDLGWDPVVAAGMDYADLKCEAYLQALFRLDRDKQTIVSEIGLLGTATAGVLAAAKAAAKEVAIVAIAFGLASSTVDNLSSNLLYDLDPSSVRTMVKNLQAKFRQSVGIGYRSRPGAFSAIRSYTLLCVPASIEAEVNLSVKQAQPKPSVEAQPSKNQPPIVTNAATVTSDQKFQSDDASEVLRTMVFPNGPLNEEARRKLEGYLSARGITVSVVSFINGASYAQERARAASFFGLTR